MANELELPAKMELMGLKVALGSGGKDVARCFGFFSRRGVPTVINGQVHRLSVLDAAKVAEISQFEQGLKTAEEAMAAIHELDNADYTASQQPAGRRGFMSCLR